MSEQILTDRKKSDPTLRDLLTPFFRWKRTVLITFCGIVLGSVIAGYLLSSQYEAQMEILVNAERSDPVVTPESTQQGPTSRSPITDEQINSEVELLTSPDVMQAVVLANNLQDREKDLPIIRKFRHRGNAWQIARATQHLAKKLKIQQVPKTNLISVSYKSSDPDLAYHVLDKLSTLYLEKHLAVHRPQGSYQLFSSETEKYQRALQESEARLADFGKQSGISAPDLQRTAMAQQLVNFMGELQTAQQAIAADKLRISDERSRMKATPERSATQQTTASAQTLLQQLQADLLTAQLKKTQLLMKYDESYPLVQEAEQEIAQTQTAIANATKEQYVNQTTDRDPTFELIREDIARTEADLATRQATAGALQNTIYDLQGRMVALDQQALKQSDLTRDVKTNEQNYLLYLSKREQERTSDALDEKRIGNVAIAMPPTEPVLPSISFALVLLVGLVLAAFAGAGAAFVAEYLNPSLRTPAEVVEVLRIPVLAAVPKQRA